MSILSNETILNMANSNEKLLGDDFLQGNIQGCSYDLRIGTIFKSTKKKLSFSKKKQFLTYTDIENSKTVVELIPSEIVVMLTLEVVNIPQGVCATVFPINKHSSKGLLILNSGHIDPGYRGPISICAINLSNESIRLNLKENIFTIIFHKLDKDSTIPYVSTYDNRSDYEIKFYKEKASKLSTSIFDLLSLNKSEPFLRKVINSVLNDKFAKYIAIFVSAVAVVGTALKVYEMVSDDKKDSKIIADDKAKISNDSIRHLNDSLKIKTLEDSLKKQQPPK